MTPTRLSEAICTWLLIVKLKFSPSLRQTLLLTDISVTRCLHLGAILYIPTLRQTEELT